MNLYQKGLALGLVVVAAAAALWLVFLSGPGGGPSGGFGPGAGAQPVYVTPARYETFVDRIESIGTLAANESITVTAKAQGIIR
ncbi:MAG: hypothetical protein RLN70_06375, partial [Rhodospirillaceae bacterium]